jgi:DNA-binding beta-propeller fold protein YncE
VALAAVVAVTLGAFCASAYAVTPVFVTDEGAPDGIVTYSPAATLPDLGELTLLGSPANPFPTDDFDPFGFALHPSGRWGYASSLRVDEVRKFDVAPNGELSNVTAVEIDEGADEGRGIAMTPDGRNVYVAGIEGEVLAYSVDQTTGELTALDRVAIATFLDGIAVHPDGSAVFVSSPKDEKIYRLSIGAGGALTPSGEESLPAGLQPGFLAMRPSRVRPVLYAAVDDQDKCVEDDRIHTYDLATFGSGASTLDSDRTDPVRPTCAPGAPRVPGNPNPNGVAVTPDGAHVYVANTGAGTIAKFDVNTDGTLAGDPDGPVTVPAPGGPYGLVATPGGDSLYATERASSEIRQFGIGPDGALTPKDPPTTSTVPPLSEPVLIAVRPDQPPVARFSVTYPGGGSTARPGEPVTFDASESYDPEGVGIVRYEWDFGDGTTAVETDPVTTHVYAGVGDFQVTLKLTDATGSSTQLTYTGQSALRGEGVPGTGTASITEEPPPPPAALQLQPKQPPQPIFAKSVNLTPVRGIVLVKVPGAKDFVPVTELTNVPVGSVVNVVDGEVRMAVQNGPNGSVQDGWFWGGVFRTSQPRQGVVSQTRRRRTRRKTLVEVKLTGGSFRDCPRSSRGRSRDGTAAGRRKKRRVRRLWGNAKGNFRSSGRHSSATVRGTRWLVEDRCDGTFTYVRSGVVEVLDLKRRKRFVLRRGAKLLIRPN